MKFRCRIGFHRWKQNRSFILSADFFPIHSIIDKVPRLKRTCIYCHCYQDWLPGYGGSELGCWLKTQKPDAVLSVAICEDLVAHAKAQKER